MPGEPARPLSNLGWLRYMRANIGGAFTQTYATANRTVATATASAVVTSPGVTSSPAGYAAISQADAIITAINALIVDDLDNRQSINAVIDTLQALGLVR